MSLHKLTAGSGYTYLTRQVAALDATDKGGVGLASYYTARGETPGAWIGSGVAGIEGLNAGDLLTPAQMQSLFGSGHHPLADEREAELDKVRTQRAQNRARERARERTAAQEAGGRGEGRSRLAEPITEAERREARRLGTPFKVYAGDISPFRIEVARRIEAVNEAAGLPRDWPVPAPERARIRTDVAAEFFRAEHGRDAADARELAATIAKHSRPKTTAVAGFDLTFSPVKSVSTLWAIAEPALAAKIELAHQAAVKDALDFIEKNALFTRTGANGVRQVDVTGLVATAFTHRDSRAGDPDLHTHVAVANKVQVLETDGTPGRWLAIDGRVLYKAAVAASETYNTALEKHLGDTLGLRFEPRVDGPTVAAAARPSNQSGGQPGSSSVGADVRKRPIREVVGVDAALNTRWSARRASIETRRSELAAAFRATHGRPPSPVEALQLAQQATLETREAKHEPRSLEEQRTAWRAQAVEVLGSGRRGEQQLAVMVSAALSPGKNTAKKPDAAWFSDASARVLREMETRMSTWQTWHVRSEAQRQVRGANLTGLTTTQVDRLVELLVDDVLDTRSVSLARPTGTADAASSGDRKDPAEPAKLRRRDASSVYTVAGSTLHTSASVLAAERRIVVAAGRLDGHRVEDRCVDLALLETAANGLTLNAGQTALVRQMATSGARVQLAIAPAGSGKTTAMNAITGAWTEGGGTVIGLAPSAAAASQLGDAIAPARSASTGRGSSNADGPDRAASRGDRVHTDTLAKLTWSITHQEDSTMPAWVEAIGPDTLVVIDEAGMADTVSLDQAINFVLDRGGSVRLVGDDQQLAAIGAGGVLRDITATHGALQLSELMRFADPAEGAASLALREGDTTALGFYLDHDRIHVGDLATMTDDLFDAWRADREAGQDAIMLAPTRDLVCELNQRARVERLSGLTGHAGASESLLSDGNRASVGELVISRTNDRRLRTSASDWVKNGERWMVLEVHTAGDDKTPASHTTGAPGRSSGGSCDLTVQHTQTGRIVRLPAEYVAESIELGYATTIHTAQGVSADAMHGLATDDLSRQLLYTMLTRGRLANHLYLPVVGDGDPHSVIRPEMVLPPTATDLLERMLARDESPTSATSLQREQHDPAVRLGDAATRYLDALHVAAEDTANERAGFDLLDQLNRTAEEISPGLAEEAAWPALRAHLLLLAAAGQDPVAQLHAVAGEDELDSARDVAAVLDWRLDDTGLRSSGPSGGQHGGGAERGVGAVADGGSPLPWMPAVPAALRAHPEWGEYLLARSELVAELAEEVRGRALGHTSEEPHHQTDHQPGQHVSPDLDPTQDRPVDTSATPVWARNGLLPDAQVIADVEVWRAAMLVDRNDRRPTGRPMLQKARARYQRSLNRRITGDRTPAMQEWGHVLTAVSPAVRADEFAPQLAERLSAISRAGIDAARLVRQAANPSGPQGSPAQSNAALPDDHAAAALWWRIAGRLSPAVAAQLDQKHGPHSLTTPWTPQLAELVGADRADRIQASAWWPTLVTVVDHALQRGWQLDTLLSTTTATNAPDGPGDAGAAIDSKTSRPSAGSASTDGLDECQAMVWRASIALDPVPADPDDPELSDEAGIPDPLGPGAPPEDLWEGHLPQHPQHEALYVDPPPDVDLNDLDALDEGLDPDPSGVRVDGGADSATEVDAGEVFRQLRQAALTRDLDAARRIQLPPSDAEQGRAYEREVDLAASPISEARMLEVNAMAHAFFEQHLPGSWGEQHLCVRFGLDPVTSQLSDQFRPGQAPVGWTSLVQHLRRHGVTDDELLATGLATTASTGRLIDRFRDRVVFPITAAGRTRLSGERGPVQILGFVGRRHPDLVDVDPASGQRNTKAGPKYLNTADTLLFHKGAQLYAGYYGDAHGVDSAGPEGQASGRGGIGALLEAGAVPVVVEGPMDAIAVTVASAGAYVGVAPLGTSLTEEQATQLASLHHRTGVRPIVATDPDIAGRVAAERAYWMLAPHGIDPNYARLPAHTDPADLLVRRGPASVAAALAAAAPLAAELLDERLDHLDRTGLTQVSAEGTGGRPAAVHSELARLVAAENPERWMDDIARITERLNQPVAQVQRHLLDAVEAWERDPRRPAQQALGGIHQVRQRLVATDDLTPGQRWAPLGAALDSRLPHEPDWGAAAMMIQDGHDQGHDVAAAARELVAVRPLGDRPAQDLRYRLVGRLNIEIPDYDDVNPHGSANPDRVEGQPQAPAPGLDGSEPARGGRRRHPEAARTTEDPSGPDRGSQRR